MKISTNLVHQYMAIFFNFSLTSSHLHPLQVENCGSNSRLVVDEDDHGKLGIERVNLLVKYCCVALHGRCAIIIKRDLLRFSAALQVQWQLTTVCHVVTFILLTSDRQGVFDFYWIHPGLASHRIISRQ